MGGVWCRADRGQQAASYSYKGPFTSTISRWTDHVRQAYRKPKPHHRPPRPPQKPLRSHERLTISPPQLVTDQSSDGWRTATLVVPQAAPVPPPRNKRRRLQELARSAYSMDDLNTHVEDLSRSTFSLPERYPSEKGLDSKGSSSTLIVTPVLESRVNHEPTRLEVKEENMEIEDSNKDEEKKIEEVEEDDNDEVDFGDEIIPVEKETMFTSRKLVHSNLGYILGYKLSAVSEASAESGLDDRIDAGKYSERSESVTSNESLPRDASLNIIAHIHDINNANHRSETDIDVREKTAKSKKEWLENILKEEPDPYLISRDKDKDERDAQSELLENKVEDIPGRPTSLPSGHLHLMNLEMETSVADNRASKTPPSTPEPPTHHSVLLGLLRANSVIEPEATSQPHVHEGESIFLTNTKTNIIYKSLSSDNLTDEYKTEYPSTDKTDVLASKTNSKEDLLKSNSINEKTLVPVSTNPFNCSTFNTQSDYSIRAPKLGESDHGLNTLLEDNKSNVVSSFDFKKIVASQQYVSALKDLQLSDGKTPETNIPDIVVSGVKSGATHLDDIGVIRHEDKLSVKESIKKSSAESSRRSSLTDSLHEFEMSIYDMLKESNKYRDSSDEEESIKTIKAETRH